MPHLQYSGERKLRRPMLNKMKPFVECGAGGKTQSYRILTRILTRSSLVPDVPDRNQAAKIVVFLLGISIKPLIKKSVFLISDKRGRVAVKNVPHF